MSRIGKKPIQIPDKVEVKINDDLVIVKGPKGELKQKINSLLKIELENNEIILKVKDENNKQAKALWGTFRQLINNAIIGVTNGFKKDLEISGVGFRAAVANSKLTLNIGYSHPVEYDIPSGIDINLEKNIITISGIDKQLVGETAAQIRQIKKPEPYKGKGIRYVDEVVRRKAGKQAKGAQS